MEAIFDRLENISGKGENAGYQHFLTTFSKEFLSQGHKFWVML